jgi:hypothetical protein
MLKAAGPRSSEKVPTSPIWGGSEFIEAFKDLPANGAREKSVQQADSRTCPAPSFRAEAGDPVGYSTGLEEVVCNQDDGAVGFECQYELFNGLGRAARPEH